MKYLLGRIAPLTWVFAFGLLVWIIAELPFDTLGASIARLNFSQWLGWFILNIIVIFLLVGRWQIITKAMNLSCRFTQLLRVRQAGGVISFVTPGPQFGGEPFQVYWLYKRFQVPAHSALLALGLDRFYELWVNFTVLLFAVVALTASSIEIPFNLYFLSASLFGLIVLLGAFGWLLLRTHGGVASWLEVAAQKWQRAEKLQSLNASLSMLRASLHRLIVQHKKALALALFVSLLGWIAMIAEFWLLLVYVKVPVDLFGFLVLFTAVRLAFLLPLPGGIGSVEAGIIWAFQFLNLPLAAAAELIVLMRLRDVTILLVSAAFLPSLLAPNSKLESTTPAN